MFSKKEMVERKEGVVRMDDASLEVLYLFLAFVYTGRMTDKSREGTSNRIWVSLQPQLVYNVDKVLSHCLR